jgi:hypothetical protein
MSSLARDPNRAVSVPDVLLLKAAAAAGAEERHIQCFSGFDEVSVQGSERQCPPLREFQIGSVVRGEPLAFSQPGRCRPCLVGGFRIHDG